MHMIPEYLNGCSRKSDRGRIPSVVPRQKYIEVESQVSFLIKKCTEVESQVSFLIKNVPCPVRCFCFQIRIRSTLAPVMVSSFN